MDTQTDQSQLYIQLLVGSGIVSREELSDFKTIARDLKMPLIQAIMSSGSLERSAMDLAGEALSRIGSRQVSLDMAIRALRIAVQTNIKFGEALNKVRSVHRTTKVFVSAANELTNILVEAEVITREQLGPILVKSNEYASMVGQVMVLENVISIQGLTSALTAVLMVRSGGLSRDNAVKGLGYACKQSVTLEQSLFELGTFVQPDARDVRIGELFQMAGLITAEDYAECLEIELFKSKDFEAVLEERGLASAAHLEAADNLLSSISGAVLTPSQASRALFRICRQGQNLYEAVTEARSIGAQSAHPRLGEILVAADLVDSAQVERAMSSGTSSSVRLGSALLTAGLISELHLYAALRLQSCLKQGFITSEGVVDVLRHMAAMKGTLDQALVELNIYLPSRMQWSWV